MAAWHLHHRHLPAFPQTCALQSNGPFLREHAVRPVKQNLVLVGTLQAASGCRAHSPNRQSAGLRTRPKRHRRSPGTENRRERPHRRLRKPQAASTAPSWADEAVWTAPVAISPFSKFIMDGVVEHSGRIPTGLAASRVRLSGCKRAQTKVPGRSRRPGTAKCDCVLRGAAQYSPKPIPG